MPRTKVYDEKEYIFDLVVKSQDHSDLILLCNTLSFPNAYIHTKYEDIGPEDKKSSAGDKIVSTGRRHLKTSIPPSTNL